MEQKQTVQKNNVSNNLASRNIRRKKRKVCIFCEDKFEPDYKNVRVLKTFITDACEMLRFPNDRKTGISPSEIQTFF